MPTITLNKKVFEELVGKKLPLDKLKDRISMLGTDLEKIEGNEIHVEVFPNRPDMLSEQGFARAFSSFIGAKTGLRKYSVSDSGEKLVVDKSVQSVRPHTACAIVKGLKFDDEKIREVIQIQEKLHVTYGRNRKKCAIGIYPLEKIKFPIRYTAKKPGDIKFRPLESSKIMSANEILNSHPTGKEYAHLLEGNSVYPVFIDANDEILSMPPIINSHNIGKVTEKTKDIFIECSGFDFNILQKCLNMIVATLADMGGKIYSIELSYPGKKFKPPNLEPTKMKISLDYVNKILGLCLNEKQLEVLLEKMGYGYEKGFVLVPAYRADILHQIDFVEDIAIAYGYENFKAELVHVATTGEEDKFEKFKNKVVSMLIGLGMLELNTYDLIDRDLQTKKMLAEFDVIEIADPVSLEYNSLRYWMIPSLLNVLKENKHNEYPQRIFDIGRVFKKDPSQETKIAEAERLGVLSCHLKADFTEARQILDFLFRALGIEYKIVEAEHPSFIAGRVGRVMVGKEKIAYIGELHPEVLNNFELDKPVVGFELNLTELYRVIF